MGGSVFIRSLLTIGSILRSSRIKTSEIYTNPTTPKEMKSTIHMKKMTMTTEVTRTKRCNSWATKLKKHMKISLKKRKR